MRRFVIALALVLIAVTVAGVALSYFGFKYAYEPDAGNVLSRTRPSPEIYNLWNRTFTQEQASEQLQTIDGRRELTPQNGAVQVDDALLRLGRRTFYKETFNNEVFLTDIVGILNGPLRIANVTKAIFALHGRATTNLRVEVPESVSIGDRTFQKGTFFDTGLNVPRGALVPLGMSISVQHWQVRVGITCAACHATVDQVSGKVVEGAPNNLLNAGLLLALGTNSAAYFMHTDIQPLRDVPLETTRTVVTSSGTRQALPNVAALEGAVDTALLMWPRGNFDSLTDLKADPTQIPVSFTWGNHPYGWSGNFMAGPFHGLTAQNNNVHALNSDSFLLADSSPALFNIDKEAYLAVLLQNAAKKRFRFDPSGNQKPSAFFTSVAPIPAIPAINQVVLPPTYPKGTMLSPDGTFTSSPGYLFWQQNNAMAAWQDTLVPPPAQLEVDHETKEAGRQIFEQAQCTVCHAGPFLTNNTVVSNQTIQANPARALALQKTERNFTQPVIFGFNTPVPLPAHAQSLPVPTEYLDPLQIDLAWAHHGSSGGYKVPSLVGIYWSAPYLHDGGIAVGPNLESDLGLPGTVEKNVTPDPFNSIKALVDRQLRARVVAANAASPALRRMNVQGVGHEYWVDAQAGFTDQQQRTLILYLLTYEPGR